METLLDGLIVYTELADYHERIGKMAMRDTYLMLAADAALAMGKPDEAEGLRQRLLAGNQHHMLRPYNSFAEASAASDVKVYIANMRQRHPLTQAREQLLIVRGQASSAIPATAPVLDINARQPYPLQVDAAPSRTDRPRAQPVPGGAPLGSRTAAPVPQRPTSKREPMREIPLDAAPRPAAAMSRSSPAYEATQSPSLTPTDPPKRVTPQASSTPKRTRQARQARPTRAGAWFSLTLSVIATTAALALTAFVLARPFLPVEWLRW